MSVITKQVGQKVYAYLSVREGGRVVHRYLGPLDNPEVKKSILAYEETRRIPQRLRVLFWDTRLESIGIKKNARYIIERVLETGDTEAANWLLKVYTVRQLRDVLATSRAISEKSRNFWEIWFGEKNT